MVIHRAKLCRDTFGIKEDKSGNYLTEKQYFAVENENRVVYEPMYLYKGRARNTSFWVSKLKKGYNDTQLFPFRRDKTFQHVREPGNSESEWSGAGAGAHVHSYTSFSYFLKANSFKLHCGQFFLPFLFPFIFSSLPSKQT